MASLKSYKELIVWQKSVQLVKEVYLVTANLPNSEIYGLTSQIRRSAISIPSNIAEGYGRGTRKEYNHFYSIAYGSALELETLLILASELEMITEKDSMRAIQCLEEVLRMLNTITSNNRKLVASH